VSGEANIAPEGSFLGVPVCTDIAQLDADVAILGIRYGVPYGAPNAPSDASNAPEAVRRRSQRFRRLIGNHDFDIGGDLLNEGRLRLVDCGDIPGDWRDIGGNAERATNTVRAILDRGALPIVIGGDESIVPQVLRAYPQAPRFTVVQIDAHIDYRDEMDGNRDGYSSPMRRAAELPVVERIVHVGIRGVGSARAAELAASAARGNLLVRADDLHAHGVDWLLAQLPAGGRFFITVDCDGLDPSVAPGTSVPLPGGLTFVQAAALVRGLERKGRVMGMDVTEHHPSLDVNGITAVVITRLIANLVGLVARRAADPSQSSRHQ
jgi:agmatinase